MYYFLFIKSIRLLKKIPINSPYLSKLLVMCIINAKELPLLMNKTLIYFASNPTTSKTLPDSYIFWAPDNLTQFIHELRSFDIPKFPVVCYDNEEMKLSSKAFWIFEAMGYDAIVLYGDINLYQYQGIQLVSNNLGPILYGRKLMEIDINRLNSKLNNEFIEIIFEQELRKVIGDECSIEKAQHFLEKFQTGSNENFYLRGRNCQVIGLLLKYTGKNNVMVFLGEWNIHNREPSKSSNYYSASESIYYDACEEFSPDTEEIHYAKTEIYDKSDARHYSEPLMIGYNNKSARKDNIDEQGYHCRCRIY